MCLEIPSIVVKVTIAMGLLKIEFMVASFFYLSRGTDFFGKQLPALKELFRLCALKIHLVQDIALLLW